VVVDAGNVGAPCVIAWWSCPRGSGPADKAMDCGILDGQLARRGGCRWSCARRGKRMGYRSDSAGGAVVMENGSGRG